MLSGSEKKHLADGIAPYDNIITVLSINREREFLGWFNPGFNKYSLSSTFLSKLFGNLTVNISSRLNGDRQEYNIILDDGKKCSLWILCLKHLLKVF